MTDKTKMLEQFLERVKDGIAREAVVALEEAYSDMLPYISDDTESNAALQASDVVRNIIAGHFEWDESGEYISVKSARDYSPKIRLAFTAADYDSLRDKIIERMPKCPKDAKIEMLERQLKEYYKW